MAKAGVIRVGVVMHDWTQGTEGRSNSSENYERLVKHVERLIRNDAHQLISGNADATARLIVAQLAHKHGMAPTRDIEEP